MFELCFRNTLVSYLQLHYRPHKERRGGRRVQNLNISSWGQWKLWRLPRSKSGQTATESTRPFGSFVVYIQNLESNAFTAEKQKLSSCSHLFVFYCCHIPAAQRCTQYNPRTVWLTTHPVESSFRSAMQRKLRLQPPLSFVQSLTGPKESRRTSRESKDELIISSSLLKEQARKGTQLQIRGLRGTEEMSAGGLFTSELCKVFIDPMSN